MAYLGDFDLGTTLYTKFTTVNASGVPTELSAPAAAFFSNANLTAFISGGISCETGWNSTVGLNHVQMILTTSATGMTTGSSYQIALTTGTVSGVNLKGYVVAEFSIRKRSAVMPITAGQQLFVDANGQVGAIVTSCNTIVDANVTSFSASGLASMFLTDSTTNYAAAVSGSPVHEIASNATIIAATTAVPANVTAASTNVGAVVTAVSTIVPARVTAQGIDIGAIVTAINTIAPARVTAQGIDVGAIVTAINTIANANVTSFSASGIGTLYTVNPAISYASATATSLVKALVTGVWDEVGANHTTIGSLGQELNSAGAAADPWATVLPGAYVTAQAGNIIGSRVDVSVGSRLAPTVVGRTLGVAPTGGAAVDWGNVGNPATLVDLTNTTVGFAGAVIGAVGGSILGDITGNVLGTVANVSGTVQANIIQVANVSVTGFGTVASPWGP
jgi:hypothetical protein